MLGVSAREGDISMKTSAVVRQILVSVETHLPMLQYLLPCLICSSGSPLQHGWYAGIKKNQKHSGKSLELSLTSSETHTSMDCHGKRSWPLNLVLHWVWNNSELFCMKIFKNIGNTQQFMEGLCEFTASWFPQLPSKWPLPHLVVSVVQILFRCCAQFLLGRGDVLHLAVRDFVTFVEMFCKGFSSF